MKVLYVTEQNLNIKGGARSHVLGFCNGLTENGYIVDIITPFDEGPPAFKSKAISRVHHLINIMKMRKKIITLVQKNCPDIIYYRKGFFDPAFLFLSSKQQHIIVLEINGIMDESIYFIQKVIRRIFLEHFDKQKIFNATKVVVVSQGIKSHIINQHSNLDSNKIIVENNGVNIQVFKPMPMLSCRKKINIASSQFILVFSGRVAQWHGVHIAIKAISILKNKSYFNRLKLYVVGEGPVIPYLKSLVNKFEVDNSVIFVGMKDQDTVKDYICAADVCIAPFTEKQNNNTDISPLKVFEYIACGKPIITTKVNGIPTLFDSIENCYPVDIVDPDDYYKFADVLEFHIKNPPEQFILSKETINSISWKTKSKKILDAVLKGIE